MQQLKIDLYENLILLFVPFPKNIGRHVNAVLDLAE
jgi:hypothetical protein